MILGIGTDIVEVARVARALDQFGARFAGRILRPAELAYCQGQRKPALFLAARFAAKEAIAKAFGTGIGAELGWQDMEIERRESGEPRVALHGAGRRLFEARGARQLLISLSHTDAHATAMAVLAD